MKRKFCFLSLVILLSVVGATVWPGCSGAQPEVVFEDPLLEGAVREALGLNATEPITSELAESLDTFSPSQRFRGMKNLSGLEFLTNLRELNLQDNSVSDITPLAGLTQLTKLDLGGNSISDISPLAGLTQLNMLNLHNNPISDIGPLVANPGLGAGDFISVSPQRDSPDIDSAELDPGNCIGIKTLIDRGVDVQHDVRCPYIFFTQDDPELIIPTFTDEDSERLYNMLYLELMQAVCNGQTEKARDLLKDGAAGYLLLSVLLQISEHNVDYPRSAECVKTLVDAGVEVNFQIGFIGSPMLVIAAETGHPETVKILLDAGAEVDTRSKSGKTALVWAAERGYREPVEALLDAGANVNAGVWTALTSASFKGHTEIVRVLLDAGANIADQGETALKWAATYGHTDIVKVLLDAGADVNAKDQEGKTALTVATQAGHTEIVRLLTAAGARGPEIIEPREERRRPPRRRGNPERELSRNADAGADVDAKDNLGQTALMRAASEGQTDTVLTLLETGANVNAKTDQGMTALLNAVGAGQTETVRVLLDAGADVSAKTQIGITALTIATQAGHTEIIELLEKAGAKE